MKKEKYGMIELPSTSVLLFLKNHQFWHLFSSQHWLHQSWKSGCRIKTVLKKNVQKKCGLLL